MEQTDQRDREMEALRENLSRQGLASLRIIENLDVDAVLEDVMEDARSLTGAFHAVITTLVDVPLVGVVVLDSQTWEMVSVNREAMRIVDSLWDGDWPAEELLELELPRGRTKRGRLELLEFRHHFRKVVTTGAGGSPWLTSR